MTIDKLDQEREKKFFQRQLVVFKIGKEEFGVDISDVKEIIKYERPTKIPATEDYIEGIINLRGKIIVIVDFAKKIQLPISELTNSTRVIIIDIQGSTVGFVVDECNEVLSLTGDQIREPPKTITDKINAEYIQSVGILKDRIVVLIDLGKVIESDYLKKIRENPKPVSNDGGLNELGLSKSSSNQKKAQKVLIIEDSSLMRSTLKSYMDERKFNIIEANNGEEGLKLFENEKPDVVLLDIKLPGISGVDVLKKIKEINPEASVIIESSVYDENTKEECFKLGAKRFLTKPVSKKDIIEVLV